MMYVANFCTIWIGIERSTKACKLYKCTYEFVCGVSEKTLSSFQFCELLHDARMLPCYTFSSELHFRETHFDNNENSNSALDAVIKNI